MGKTWVQKRDINKEYQVKINPKKFADIPAGTKMFIPTPQILDNFVQDIPPGSFLTLKQIRQDLSRKYHAEMTCPVVQVFHCGLFRKLHLKSIKLIKIWMKSLHSGEL